MIDARLFKAIEDLARVQGGLTGAGEAFQYLYPSAAKMMENYADDLKAIGDVLMDIIGAGPQVEVSEVTAFSKEDAVQIKCAVKGHWNNS